MLMAQLSTVIVQSFICARGYSMIQYL